MIVPFTAVSAIIPSLLLLWYFHTRDVNREPARVVWATFGLGVLTVVPVLLVALPVQAALGTFENPFVHGLSKAFFTAAVPEELFKYLVVVGYCMRHKEFDEPMDGIVYGVVASLGFATLENVLYVSESGLGVAVLRAFTAVPGHACTGAIMGYYLGRARFAQPDERAGLMFRGFAVPTLLHGLYDAPLFAGQALSQRGSAMSDADGALVLLMMLTTLAVLIAECVWAVRLVRRLRAAQLAGGRPAPQAAAFGGAPGPQPWTPAGPSAPFGPPQPPAAAPWMQQPPTASPWGAPPAASHPPSGFGAAAPYAPAPYAPAPYAPAPSAGGAPGGWVMVVAGALLASGGGLLTLGVGLGIAMGAPGAEDLGATVIGGIIIGVLPLALGLFLFARGLRRVGRASLPAAQPTARPAYQAYPR